MAKLARACNTWRMDIITQSIAVFLEDAPRHLATLGEAVERDDPHAPARAAHSLKGAAVRWVPERERVPGSASC